MGGEKREEEEERERRENWGIDDRVVRRWCRSRVGDRIVETPLIEAVEMMVVEMVVGRRSGGQERENWGKN